MEKNDTPAKAPETPREVALAPLKAEIAVFNRYDDPEALMAFAKMLWASGLNAFDKPEDVATVMVWAKEMNYPMVNALAHCLVVNSKLGIDSHVARALISSAGIVAETIEDYRPIYNYSAPDRVYSQEEIDAFAEEYYIFYDAAVVHAKIASKEIVDGKYKNKIAVIRSPQPVDHRTVIKFTRYVKTPNGYREWIEYGKFNYQEAVDADLVKKSNWQNWPSDCCYARAYMRGSRRIADDKIQGVYSKLELADMADNDIPLTIEEI